VFHNKKFRKFRKISRKNGENISKSSKEIVILLLKACILVRDIHFGMDKDSNHNDKLANEILIAIKENSNNDYSLMKNDIILQFGRDIEEIEDSTLLTTIKTMLLEQKEYTGDKERDEHDDFPDISSFNDDTKHSNTDGAEHNLTDNFSALKLGGGYGTTSSDFFFEELSSPAYETTFPLSARGATEFSRVFPSAASNQFQGNDQELGFSNHSRLNDYQRTDIPSLSFDRNINQASVTPPGLTLPAQPPQQFQQQQHQQQQQFLSSTSTSSFSSAPTVISNDNEFLSAFWEISLKIFFNICSPTCVTKDCLHLIAGKRLCLSSLVSSLFILSSLLRTTIIS
jgi:hypothetical protein